MMTGRFGYGMHGGGEFFATFLFAILIIGLVYFLWRRGQAFQNSPIVKQAQFHERLKTDPAEAILRERYARGEIDDDEFDQRLKKLTGQQVKVEEVKAEEPKVDKPEEVEEKKDKED